MNTKKNATIAICLAAILALSPVANFAQATTTFSGEAVALRASAVGIHIHDHLMDQRSNNTFLSASGQFHTASSLAARSSNSPRVGVVVFP